MKKIEYFLDKKSKRNFRENLFRDGFLFPRRSGTGQNWVWISKK